MKKYSDLHFTWLGDVTSYSGWAQHARGILRPIIEGGAQVRLEMISPGRPESKLDSWWEEQFPILSKASPGDFCLCHGDISLVSNYKSNIPTILSTHWETKTVPVSMVEKINSSKHIGVIVPNKSLELSAVEKINKQIFTVTCPIQVKKLKNIPTINLSGIEESTIVLGAVGEWNNRRNLSDVVVAYLRSFNSNDNVALVLKTFGQDINSVDERSKMKDLILQIKRDAKKHNLPKIILLQDALSYETMNCLLSRINIYVSASRGESKDIAAQNCAFMGKQCIVPMHSAYKDMFTNAGIHIYKVPYTYEPVILSSGHYNINDDWARINSLELSNKMKEAYSDLLTNGKMIEKDAQKFSSTLCNIYSIEKSASLFATAIRKITTPIPTIDFSNER